MHCLFTFKFRAIGRLSMHIDAVVRSGSQEFSDAGEIVRYCNLKLRVHNLDDAMCCHWQRHYFEVWNINRDESLKCKILLFEQVNFFLND